MAAGDVDVDTTPISPIFGVRITGIDTAQPASPQVAKRVRDLLKEHKLIIIKGGELTAQQVAAFGRSLELGPTKEFGAKHLTKNLALTADPAVAKLAYGPDLPAANINLWHQDHTWHEAPTRYELSYAHTVTLGGDVLYADAGAAYKSLSPKMRAFIDGSYSTALLANGYAELPFPTPAFAQSMLATPPVQQPVVSVVDGERILTVNKAYSVRITDLSPDESTAALQLLTSHIARPEHCVRVSYEVGDLVIFDNHKLQHYAVSDYYPRERSILRMSFRPQPLVGAPPAAPHAALSASAPPPPYPVESLGEGSAAKRARTATTEPPEATADAADAAAMASRRLGHLPLAHLPPAAASVSRLATSLTAALRLLDRGPAPQSDLCAGFFSARLVESPTLFVTGPTHGTFWREATPEAFGVFRASLGATKPHRERLVGTGPLPNYPSTAVPAAIYASCPNVHAIVHAHPRSMMALSALDPGTRGTVLPMSEPSFMFYERVAHLPCNFFFDDAYLAQIVAALRDGSKFCIAMANHSFLMTGRTVEEAYLRAYMLEQSASIQLAALSASGGELPPTVPREECLFHRASYEGYAGCPPYDGSLEWAGLVRGLDEDCAGWRGDGGARLVEAARVVLDAEAGK